MANRRSIIRVGEVTRLLRAAKRAGLDVAGVDVDTSAGTIRLLTKPRDDTAPAPGNALDEWLAKHARQT